MARRTALALVLVPKSFGAEDTRGFGEHVLVEVEVEVDDGSGRVGCVLPDDPTL
ncbi:hypothetical protein ACIQWB_10770 [Streptomyces olivaceus]|uniref:hypothetical protein n=1 Tax=Streptomyces olivaceus TaxID=47716 RepID=UPI00382B5BDE